MPADELPGNVELEIEGRRERENAKMGTTFRLFASAIAVAR